MFTGEIVGGVSQPRIFADPDAGHFNRHHARDLGYPASFTHRAAARSIMFTSSSASQFISSSSSALAEAVVDSTLSAPSTGLTARTAMSVPVQEQGFEISNLKRPGHVTGLFPTLHEARELLRGQAEALHFLARGCSLAYVPSHLKSYRVCLQAVTRDSSGLGAMELHHIPAAHLTPELVRAAVSKHPEAIGILGPEHRTLDLYELAGKRADFDAFRELPVTQQVAADPRYQAVLASMRR
jgi:hypothetical protein